MIAVMGSGAFGTGLAISLAQNGPVLMWARDATHVAEMAETRENTRRLTGAKFPDTLSVTHDLNQLVDYETVLLAVPTQTLRVVLEKNAGLLAGKTLVACCKGVEVSTQKSPSQIIADCVPSATPAVLTGPSFARDIANGLPTALTLACENDTVGETLQANLRTPNIRIYRTTDVTGAELGGALKNIMAIACGIAIGAGLGDSARAALMTRGFAEMQRMAIKLGAQSETLSGLSGFGDLTLTCTSEQSRNMRFGLCLGRGEGFDPNVTVEGVATSRAVSAKAAKLSVDMPITNAVVAVIDKNLRVDQAMDMLLSRPLKEE